MKIWIAVVAHRHGQNVYAARTRKKLVEELYDYVRRWWASEIPDEELPEHLAKKKIVDRYFERVGHEWLDTLTSVTVA